MKQGFTRLALERIHISEHDGEPVCAVAFTAIRGVEKLAAPIGKFTHLLRLDGATVGLTQEEAEKVAATLREYPPSDAR